MKIHPQILPLKEKLIGFRRYLHQNPELSFQEYKTSSFVVEILRQLNLEIIQNVGSPTGVIAVLRGEAGEGPCLLFRADMDALPIQDIKDVEYKSQIPNVQHSCGHDAHVSSLLGAAIVLSGMTKQLKGSIKFCFQPAEEICQGAILMIQDKKYPVLDAAPRVDLCFALHVWVPLKIGTIGTSFSTVSSFINFFNIKVEGKSCHGSAPDKGIDAIVTAAQLINGLQSVVSRSTDPQQFAVLTIGKIDGGTANNVVANKCEFSGSTRAYTQKISELIQSRMIELCKGYQLAFLSPQIVYTLENSIPAVINEVKATEASLQV